MLKPMLKLNSPPPQPQAAAFCCDRHVRDRAAASSPAIASFFMGRTSFRSCRVGPSLRENGGRLDEKALPLVSCAAREKLAGRNGDSIVSAYSIATVTRLEKFAFSYQVAARSLSADTDGS